jgi:hypothetical protein
VSAARQGSRGRRRTLQGDLHRLQERFGQSAAEADRMLRDAASAQPLLTVGAAAGLGFVLGGGLSGGAVTVLLGVGARLAGTWLQQEFLESPHPEEDEA